MNPPLEVPLRKSPTQHLPCTMYPQQDLHICCSSSALWAFLQKPSSEDGWLQDRVQQSCMAQDGIPTMEVMSSIQYHGGFSYTYSGLWWRTRCWEIVCAWLRKQWWVTTMIIPENGPLTWKSCEVSHRREWTKTFDVASMHLVKIFSWRSQPMDSEGESVSHHFLHHPVIDSLVCGVEYYIAWKKKNTFSLFSDT